MTAAVTGDRCDWTGGGRSVRLAYVVVADLVVGVLGSALALRYLRAAVTPAAAGFGSPGRSLGGVAAGVGLGAGAYLTLGGPALDPIVVLNGFMQAWPTSTAEVVVCWSVAGAATSAGLRARTIFAPRLLGALVASVLFGVSHVAHSPPFNTVSMVALLTGVGLLTSAFFLVVRDVHGTIVFHNFLAAVGVLQALGRSGKLADYDALGPWLLLLAVAALLVLAAVHLWLRRRAGPGDERRGAQGVGGPEAGRR